MKSPDFLEYEIPERHWTLKITDMITAIQKILKYIKGLVYEDFAQDRLAVDAVSLNIVILGEASAHVPEHIRQAHPEIPWRNLRDMQRFTDYVNFRVDDREVWKTITNDLPPLIPQLQAILED